MKFSRYPARVFAVLVTLAAVVLLPELASAGDPAFRTLYGFQGGADGWLPLGVPAVDKEGNLYGVTNMGGGGAQFWYGLQADRTARSEWHVDQERTLRLSWRSGSAIPRRWCLAQTAISMVLCMPKPFLN